MPCLTQEQLCLLSKADVHIQAKGCGMPDDEKASTRLPIPDDNLVAIQKECVELDDDVRWLVALISDTGMRLAEAAGLLV